MMRSVMLRRWMIGAVLAVFLIVSACGGGSGGSALSGAAQPSNEDNAEEIHIIASNFQFDQKEYVIRKDQPVTFLLTNESGYHEAKIQGLNINLRPGKPQQYVITEPGTYRIVCSIMCGSGHSSMVSTLVVEE